jgi:hypothetical protein
MAPAVPARLSPDEGRKFGLTVGGAFLLLGALLWWRGKALAPAMGTLGACLALAGVAVPNRLGPIQRAWMGLAHAISRVTTPVFMGVVYFVVLTPVALLRRAFGHNAIAPRSGGGSYWIDRRAEGTQSTGMERQF